MAITRETVLEKMHERICESFEINGAEAFRGYIEGVFDMTGALLMKLAQEEKNEQALHSGR